MNAKHIACIVGLAAIVSISGVVAAERPTLVFCAPGYPSNTEEAAPTIEAFAGVVADAAGRSGGLSAVYHPEEDAGVERLRQADAALAFVTLPFYLKHKDDLELVPMLHGVQEGNALETWSLVAAAGRIRTAADLAGWDVTGTPGYAPGFVRGTALGAWGDLPADTTISFTPRVLSALRKTTRGEDIAVLLDGPQSAGLDRLPFADSLEVVTRSGPVPSSVLCTVGGRIADGDRAAWSAAFLALADAEAGREALTSVRLERFEPLDDEALAAAAETYAAP